MKRRREKIKTQSSLLSKVTRLLTIHENRDSAGRHPCSFSELIHILEPLLVLHENFL